MKVRTGLRAPSRPKPAPTGRSAEEHRRIINGISCLTCGAPVGYNCSNDDRLGDVCPSRARHFAYKTVPGEASGRAMAVGVALQYAYYENRPTFPVGLLGIANMAPLIVGPRCTMPIPCGVCWYCKTWEERARLLRFTGTPHP